MPDYCPYSGKLIYERPRAAWKVIRAQRTQEWRYSHKTPPPEIRPYHCSFCGQWHLGTHKRPAHPYRRWRGVAPDADDDDLET